MSDSTILTIPTNEDDNEDDIYNDNDYKIINKDEDEDDNENNINIEVTILIKINEFINKNTNNNILFKSHLTNINKNINDFDLNNENCIIELLFKNFITYKNYKNYKNYFNYQKNFEYYNFLSILTIFIIELLLNFLNKHTNEKKELYKKIKISSYNSKKKFNDETDTEFKEKTFLYLFNNNKSNGLYLLLLIFNLLLVNDINLLKNLFFYIIYIEEDGFKTEDSNDDEEKNININEIYLNIDKIKLTSENDENDENHENHENKKSEKSFDEIINKYKKVFKNENNYYLKFYLLLLLLFYSYTYSKKNSDFKPLLLNDDNDDNDDINIIKNIFNFYYPELNNYSIQLNINFNEELEKNNLYYYFIIILNSYLTINNNN